MTGLALASVHPSATAVWPPTGIAIAAGLLLGPGAWAVVFLAAFFVNVTTAGTVATSLGIAFGNMLEAILGARAVARFAGGPAAVTRVPDLFRFGALAFAVT